jgi:hypothetical protein
LDKIGSGAVVRRLAGPASYQILHSGPIHPASGGAIFPRDAGYGKTRPPQPLHFPRPDDPRRCVGDIKPRQDAA